MMRFVSPTACPLVFEPDGSVDADDRAMLLGLYSGIALGTPVVFVGDILEFVLHIEQSRSFTLSVEQQRAFDLHIEQEQAFTLER